MVFLADLTMKNREFHGTVGRLKMGLDLMGFNGTFDVMGYLNGIQWVNGSLW